jgi:hypothetical protein
LLDWPPLQSRNPVSIFAPSRARISVTEISAPSPRQIALQSGFQKGDGLTDFTLKSQRAGARLGAMGRRLIDSAG